jgi:4-amino-4-deoxy-L-arabinose transferase-like glycosyltransferase
VDENEHQGRDTPEQDTMRMPQMSEAPWAPPAPTRIDDIETAPMAVPIAHANDIGDISDVDTARIPAAHVTDIAREATTRLPALKPLRQADASLESGPRTPQVVAPLATFSPPAAALRALQNRLARYDWLRYPEFWLITLLGAALRLWNINLTSFLDDQAGLMRLARAIWSQGALPITGIPSSIGTQNPPLSIYLLAPFTLLSKDPLPAVASIALWNVIGVALCYIFTHRYFGRFAAASGTLLFASCPAAVNYSRFLWQQNYLAPVLMLWMLTLCLGCVQGRRRWFVPHVALLAAAILLHSTAALLIPVSLVGLALTPRRALPSRWEWALTAAVIAILLAPTALWEYLSGGYDIHAFACYLRQPSMIDLDVFRMITAVLGAPSQGNVNPDTLYARAGSWATTLNNAAVFCFAVGTVILTARIVRTGVQVRKQAVAAMVAGKPAARHGMLALWRELRANPAWRVRLLLWLWIVAPVALMLRHNSDLYPHYLLVLYPAAFIVSGFTFQAALRLSRLRMPRADLTGHAALAATVALLLELALAQGIQAALYPATIASGDFDALISYGYPLAEAQQLDAAMTTLQADQGARAIFVSLSQMARYAAPLDYLLISEHPDRVGYPANCLVLPAPDEEPALILPTPPAGPANALIPHLPNLQTVATLSMTGSESLTVYQMDGKIPLLPGEQALAPVTFANATGDGLRLEAMAVQPDGTIRLRWTILGSATGNQGVPFYSITPTFYAANDARHIAPYTSCRPTRWHAGETLFTWTTASTSWNATRLRLQVFASHHPIPLRIGPLHLVSGYDSSAPFEQLLPSTNGAPPAPTLMLPLPST